MLAVAFGFCLWQNHALLDIINKPLKAQTQKQVEKGEGTAGQAVLAQQGVLEVAARHAAALAVLAAARQRPVRRRRARSSLPLIAALRRDVAKIPRNPTGRQPRDARRGRAVHDDDHGRAATSRWSSRCR